jgi:hypothetical protein
MGTGIPAHGTRSDDCYLPTHAFLLAFLAAVSELTSFLFISFQTQSETWRRDPGCVTRR